MQDMLGPEVSPPPDGHHNTNDMEHMIPIHAGCAGLHVHDDTNLLP